MLECGVEGALGSITMNKASGGDGIPVDLFQVLKDDALNVLHSIYQQIWGVISQEAFEITSLHVLEVSRWKIKGALFWNALKWLVSYPWQEDLQRSWVDKYHQGLADPCLGRTVRNQLRRGPEGWWEEGPFLVYYSLKLQLLWLWTVQRITQRDWIPAHLPLLSSVLWRQHTHCVGRCAFTKSLYMCKVTQAINQELTNNYLSEKESISQRSF